MLLYITLRIRIIFALDGFILAWISSGFISTIGDILNKISIAQIKKNLYNGLYGKK